MAVIALAERVFYDTIPFNRELGFRPGHTRLDEVATVFDLRPELVGNFEHGILHGGVIAAAIDSTAGMMAFISMFDGADLRDEAAVRRQFAGLGTIDMRVDYLRPGEGTTFTVTARLVRRGRRVTVVRADLENERGSLIATGTATYMVG